MDIVALDLSNFDQLINQIASDLHKGRRTPEQLNSDLIQATYDDLDKAAAEGFGKQWGDLENNSDVLKIRQNLYRFSGAKTYQQLEAYNSFLVDKDGKIRNFTDFKRKVKATSKDYNGRYLQAEYQHAKRSAQSARQWDTFVKNADLFPNLQYFTQDDERVREEHQPLNKIIRPVNDPFWDKFTPPNGWGCRCYVQSTDEEASNGKKIKLAPGFANNPGKSKQLFAKDHPYNSIPKEVVPDVKNAFELFKNGAPYVKTKGIKVSSFADTNTLKDTMSAALLVYKKLKDDVIIEPHINLKGYKNPKLKIDGVKGVLKAIESFKGIKYGIQAAKKQGAPNVVFSLDKITDLNITKIITEVKRQININRGRSFKNLYFIYNGKVVRLTREQIINQDFDSLKAIKPNN